MLRDIIRILLEWRRQRHQQHHQIMAALDNLNASLVKLQASVDAAVTEITTPHPTDAQVQAAADTIQAQAARLDAAVASQNPTPPAPPAP